MFTTTDYIVLAILLFSFWNGWRRGFLRSLIGPCSLIVCSILSFFYFQKTQNLPLSLLIALVGPVCLNILFSSVLKIWQKTVNEDKPLLTISRTLGALFDVFWNVCFIVLSLVLILLIPSQIFGINKIQKNIKDSIVYSILNHFIPTGAPQIEQIQSTFTMLKNPSQYKSIESIPEFQKIIHDDKIQDILSDKVLVEQMQNREITKVLSNPKIQGLFKDKKMIESLFVLEKKLLENTKTKQGSAVIPE